MTIENASSAGIVECAPPTDKRFVNLSGQRFGRLLVKSFGRSVKNPGKISYLCLCDCGASVIIYGSSLRNGGTRSCGCLRRELVSKKFKKHGVSHGPEYRAWSAMMTRCRNRNSKSWAVYGGAGITVSDRWNDFSTFLADMGQKPTPKHELDRIDGKGSYEPGNVRWATRTEQMRNVKSNHIVTFNGRSMCIAAWSEFLGFATGVIWNRIMRYGWSIERALTEAPRPPYQSKGGPKDETHLPVPLPERTDPPLSP